MTNVMTLLSQQKGYHCRVVATIFLTTICLCLQTTALVHFVVDVWDKAWHICHWRSKTRATRTVFCKLTSHASFFRGFPTLFLNSCHFKSIHLHPFHFTRSFYLITNSKNILVFHRFIFGIIGKSWG